MGERRADLKGKIAALLGGRAAELVFFGEASTGAADDLGRATEAARAMEASPYLLNFPA